MTADPARRRTRLPAPERRRLILEAAAELFAQRGFDAGSIDAIGERVGISGPAIYRHFPRKQDIVIALLDDAIGRALEEARAAEHEAADPHARLVEASRRLADLAVRERAVLGLLAGELPGLSKDDRERIVALRDQLLGWWIDALRAWRPYLEPVRARLLVRGIFALAATLARVPDPEAGDALVPTMEAMILALLAA